MKLLLFAVVLIAIMGFTFKNRKSANKSHTPPQKQGSQIEASRWTLQQLRAHNITDTSFKKIEFFFYTPITENAQKLTSDLYNLGYEVKYEPSAHNKLEFVITGRTTRMQMSEEVVLQWTEKMNQLAAKHHCLFDGWGTDIKPN